MHFKSLCYDKKLFNNRLAQFVERNNEKGSNFSLIALKDMHFETDLQNSSFMQGNTKTVYIYMKRGKIPKS